MPIFVRNQQRVAFIHIPKAAGSSIEKHFEQNGWQMDYYKPCQNPNEPALQHLTYQELRKIVADLDALTSFCIVRNPFKRIVSEWRWQRTRMRTTKLGFPDFVHRVEVSLTQSKTYWDNHWRPQSDFIDDNIDSVMRIENLDKDFGEFAAGHDLGFTENIPIFGQSKYGKFPQLSVNEESLDRVRRIYEKDFEAFGYPLEPPTLK